MKQILLLASLVVFTQSMQAQSFVDTTKVWSILECSIGPFEINCLPVYYKLHGDTTIDARNYTNLHKTSDTTLQTWYPAGAMRDTAMRVFCHDFVSEHLLYDFSANRGDTIKSISFCSPYYLIVDSVDTVIIHGESKRRLLFNWPACTITEEWIEDIGSMNGLINPLIVYGNLIADYGAELLCYEQQDTVKFINPRYNNCNFRTTGIQETGQMPTISIYPNPARGIVYCELNQGFETLNRIAMKNLLGQIVFEKSQVRLGNHLTHSIDLSHVSEGIYILEIMNEAFTSSHKIIIGALH